MGFPKAWVAPLLCVLCCVLGSTPLGNNPSQVTEWDFEERKIIYELPGTRAINTSLVDWGLTLPGGSTGTPCSEGDQCMDFGSAKVVITNSDNCQTVDWTTSQLTELKDCVNLVGHWYGGGEQFTQPWPLETNPRLETAFVTGDMLSSPWWYGGVTERYWFGSSGVAVRVDDSIPLFLSIPETSGDRIADQLCFSSRYETPFVAESISSDLKLTYELCYADDVKQVYESSFSRYFPYPSGIPDQRMMTDPIWSTWAEYSTEVNSSRVINLAQAIIDNGFNNSQIEIDDNWETCYGEAVFNPDRFSDPKAMVDTLHSMGFRVTLWIHPFINIECDSFDTADQNQYFIKDSSGVTQLTKWWQGKDAGLIDPTNPDAVTWWNARLLKIQSDYGIDSFKFDAGESTWMPDVYTLNLNKSHWPNGFTTAYADQISVFGNMIEDRVGHRSQEKNFFVRMLDKNSFWNEESGLKTLVTTMLHSGLLGYPFVLPDMIGGNAYEGKPSSELFIRWAQANTFMPSIQFSLLPWEYGDESDTVVEIAQQVTSLHAQFAPYIIELAQNTTLGQGPIARPTWWLCPTTEDCLLADQQFLLGDDVLVAPVVDRGTETVQVVFPPGNWQLLGSGPIYVGPMKQAIFGLDLYSIIYFIRAA